MAVYAGSYSDGASAARIQVQVTLKQPGLECCDRDGRVVARWPYGALALVEPPYPGRPLRLRNGRDPARLALADAGILDELVRLAPQLRPRRHRQTGVAKALVLGLAGIALVHGHRRMASVAA